MDDLESRLADVEDRLAALESEETTAPPRPAPDDDRFWALDGLRAQIASAGLAGGAVMMAGAVTAPNGQHAEWQYAEPASGFFDEDFSEHVDVLSALAHPVRLQLLQRLLTDGETVADLQATEQFGTTGQIYHHLRQLVAAGWLRQAGGGRYQVPAQRLVPLLTMLMGARR